EAAAGISAYLTTGEYDDIATVGLEVVCAAQSNGGIGQTGCNGQVRAVGFKADVAQRLHAGGSLYGKRSSLRNLVWGQHPGCRSCGRQRAGRETRISSYRNQAGLRRQ